VIHCLTNACMQCFQFVQHSLFIICHCLELNDLILCESLYLLKIVLFTSLEPSSLQSCDNCYDDAVAKAKQLDQRSAAWVMT